MVKEKTQVDYWNEGVKFAKEENWQKAIENYEKAVALKVNPALYTNLAACYKHLDNLEKEAENYLLAVPGLLNREYTNTFGPANSTAWWLFEQNKDLESAKTLSEIAIDIDNNSEVAFDTYVNILLKLEDENAIKKLTELKFRFPEHEASYHLFEKYKNEIEEFLVNYWEEESREDRVRAILEKDNYYNDVLDFIIDGKSKMKTSNFYPYNTSEVYNKLKSSFIKDDDEIMKRFFKAVFSIQDLY